MALPLHLSSITYIIITSLSKLADPNLLLIQTNATTIKKNNYVNYYVYRNFVQEIVMKSHLKFIAYAPLLTKHSTSAPGVICVTVKWCFFCLTDLIWGCFQNNCPKVCLTECSVSLNFHLQHIHAFTLINHTHKLEMKGWANKTSNKRFSGQLFR